MAVVGDSHAPPVFHGMVEKNSALGLNSVLLLYSPLNCETRVLDVIKKKEDISDVFIVMRGVNYLAGGLDVDGQQPYDPAWELCSGDYFKTWLQNFVDDLNGAGKRIYIVSENPVFPSLPRVPLNRPFVLSPRSAAIIAKDEVYEHQKVYLDTLAGIHGAEIINGMDLFCPDGQCSMFAKNGTPLYVDDDHLSAYGGVYLVENLLEPYLSAIAERGTDQ